MPRKPYYECDQCGACCKGTLIVEAYDVDVLREPKLTAFDKKQRDDENTLRDLMYEFEEEVGRCLVLACGKDKPCPFLNEDNACSIYPTRPNVCVAMEAGSEQCQQARAAMVIEPLQPIQQEDET